jgi:hypothetical protein
MFGFAAFSDAGFSSQTTADARIIAGTQVVTGTVAGATILGGAIIAVSGNSMTSSVGTPTGLVIALPGTNLMTSSIAGVTTGVVIPIGSANLGMTPETNLLTGSTGSPSLFTWVDVNDNVTAETWTDVETEDSTESWSNV